MSLLDLLKAGNVSEFNATRGQRARVDLFAVELEGASLVGADLSGANAAKSDFTDADLTDATLYRTDMVGIDGEGIKLVGALAHQVRLREAWLVNAELSDADFTKGNLSEATMTGSKGDHIRMMGTKLKGVTADNVVWPEVDLSEASFFQANFEGADLRRAFMNEAKGAEAKFIKAQLDGILATGVKLQEADFTGASLVGAKLDGANLAGANLSGADLTVADLSRANLTGAKLDGAILRGCSLASASLDGVDLSGVDVTEVDLSGVDPRALGLSDAQIAAAARVGADVDPNSPISVGDPAVAVLGDTAAAIWLNADGEESASVRYAVLRPGQDAVNGVLPLGAEGALSQGVLAVGDEFWLLVFQDRPGGVCVVRYPLSVDGQLGASKVEPLGYEPAVTPSLRSIDGKPFIWGLSRRGPTLIVHGRSDDPENPGWVPVATKTQSTARGIYGRSHPVLAAKGGVVMPVTTRGIGAPFRTPEAFAGSLTTAVPVGDRILCLWLTPKKGERDPGGLRFAYTATRGHPETEILTVYDGVMALDAEPEGPEAARVAWAETEPGQPAKVFHVVIPGGEVKEVKLPKGVDVEELRFARSEQPVALALTTLEEGLVVVGLDGKLYGRVGD